jgi:tRNA 2-thiouridine synthesizing protein A
MTRKLPASAIRNRRRQHEMGDSMAETMNKAGVRTIDARGLKCPLPTLRLETEMFSLHPGDIVDVLGDCSTMEADFRALCERRKIALLLVTDEGAAKRVRIRI